MSGFLGIAGRFLQAMQEFAEQIHPLDLYDDLESSPALSLPQPGTSNSQGNQPAQQAHVPSPQLQAGVPNGVALQPAAAPQALVPTLAERLVARQAAIGIMRQTLTDAVWNLASRDPVLEERAGAIEAWVVRGRAVPECGSDADADQRLTELDALIATTDAIIRSHANRIAAIHRLYAQHPGLPGIPREADQIVNPLLCSEPPDETAVTANLRSLEIAFKQQLLAGFDDAEDKASRFVTMWSLRTVSPIPASGVGDIYTSSFDGPQDRFGVSWNLKGLPGWVLHGHAELVWDDREENVIEFLLPRLHIKSEEGAHGQGGTTPIADAAVVNALRTTSLKHVQRMAKNRLYAEVFARTKFKKRA